MIRISTLARFGYIRLLTPSPIQSTNVLFSHLKLQADVRILISAFLSRC